VAEGNGPTREKRADARRAPRFDPRPVRRIGKLIDGGPSGTRRHAGIAGEQMLMEVFTSQTDHRDMDAFRAFLP
jgi:hypothetical protein